MKKLAHWIRTKLGIVELETRVADTEQRCRELEATTEAIGAVIDIGVDMDYNGGSWAVICVRGRQEYVRFATLEPNELRELQRFLDRLQPVPGLRPVVDVPMGTRRHLRI